MRKVRVEGGVPYFEEDGKILVPAGYMTYITKNADYASFSRAGFDLFCTCVRLSEFAGNEETGLTGGFSPQTWVGENEFDFSSLDKDIARILEETGKADARIILRINLNMPGWWRKKYPEELTLFDDGETLMQSIHSLRWRKDAGLYLTVLKKHLEEAGYAKNVIAWQPAAMHTEEWFAPMDVSSAEDFSRPATDAFIAYCKEKYQNTGELNAAWGTEYASFNEVSIPTAKEREEKDGKIGERARDYYFCKNDSYAQTADWFCGYIKKLFDGDILTGCFGGYIGQLGKNYGHCSFSKLLRSENIDFFASPLAYTNLRAKAVDWMYHSAIESTRRAGKLWFIEADVRTEKTKLLPECAPWLFGENVAAYYLENPVWVGPEKKNSVRNVLRTFAKTFISRNAFWWFDMWGGWYADEDYESLMKKTRDLYAAEVGKEIKSACEVAVILDEKCTFYIADDTFWKAVYEEIISLGYLGAPYDFLLLQGLKAEDLSNYKEVLFLAPAPTKENIAFAKEVERTGKKVYVSGDETGAFGGAKREFGEEELQKSAADSGVHIYSAGNIVYANEKYISLTARRTGEVVLAMPKPCVLTDCVSGKKLRADDGTVRLSMEENETFLWEISLP